MSNKKIIQGMRIFYDVDTQNDFMNKDGALYVPGAEEIKPNLEKLTNYAKKELITIWKSEDRHFKNDPELKRNGGQFPDHCMNRSYGLESIAETNHDPEGYCTKTIPHKTSENNSNKNSDMNDNTSNNDSNTFHPSPGELGVICAAAGPQPMLINGKWKDVAGYNLVFEKQHYDVFTNMMVSVLMATFEVKQAVVYGVATDYCVKAAVIGMQERGIQCYVVNDAIAAVTPETGKSALEEMVEAGAKLVTTQEVLDNKMDW